MTSRRGIFFNSKSRTTDKINQLPTEISTEDPNSNNNNNNPTTTVKKKIILNHSKRTLTKTIYSGPRKIFSRNYKVFLINSKEKHYFISEFIFRLIELN
jgi:hypothetical protein